MNKGLVTVGVVLLVVGVVMILLSQMPHVNTHKTYQQLQKISNVDTRNISWRTWLEADKEYRIELKNDGGNVVGLKPWNLTLKSEMINKSYSDTLYSGLKSLDDVGTKLAVFEDISVEAEGFYDAEITGPHAYSFCWLLFYQVTTISETSYSHIFTLVIAAAALIMVGAAMVARGKARSRNQIIKPRPKSSYAISP